MESLLFYIFGVLALLGAFLTITRPNPVHSVLFLVLTFFCLAGIYVLLVAEFVAVIQVAVYAGAIMVLFLFVVMLLNLSTDFKGFFKITFARLVGFGLGIVVLCIVGYLVRGTATAPPALPDGFGTIGEIGNLLFTRYLLHFEAISVLLFVALVAGVVLAKRRTDEAEEEDA